MQNKLILGFEQVIKQKTVPVLFYSHILHQQINKLRQCKKFRDYIHKMNSSPNNVSMQRIQVSCMLMFSGDRIGYVTIKVAMTIDGISIQKPVFIRGGSVAILLFINQKLAVVQQYRVPAQKTFIQPPAGMIDQSGDLASKAIDQLFQQTGVKINKQMLIYLCTTVPNVAICDEEIHLYYCQIKLTKERMKEIQNKQRGEEGTHQKIIVRIIEYDPYVILATGNSAFISLACLYENRIKNVNNNLQSDL